jgi:hypothetical protein
LLAPQPVADARGETGVVPVTDQNIGGRAAQELLQGTLAARDRQIEKRFIESQPADSLIERAGAPKNNL